MKSTFAEAWERLWADTPKFFNKIKIIGGSLIATGTVGANRIYCNTGTDITLIASFGLAEIQYDATTARWRAR